MDPGTSNANPFVQKKGFHKLFVSMVLKPQKRSKSSGVVAAHLLKNVAPAPKLVKFNNQMGFKSWVILIVQANNQPFKLWVQLRFNSNIGDMNHYINHHLPGLTFNILPNINASFGQCHRLSRQPESPCFARPLVKPPG